AFLSNSNNLVAGITYSSYFGSDLFLRDLTTNATKLVSVSVDGTHNGVADTGAFNRNFALSADGRYVVFSSRPDNLGGIRGATGVDDTDVYVRDMSAGVTTMVSVSLDGIRGGNQSSALDTGAQMISADGRYVAFHSRATNLVDVPVNGVDNAYL